MTKIRVKINAPSPSLSTVRSYRDFDGFLKQYQKYYSTSGIRQMLYNDKKKLVYIVIIILFLLMLLFVDDISAQTFSNAFDIKVE
ncbi:MAG: hypothetical protein AAF149_10385 [Bacteroidota bacterium]